MLSNEAMGRRQYALLRSIKQENNVIPEKKVNVCAGIYIMKNAMVEGGMAAGEKKKI